MHGASKLFPRFLEQPPPPTNQLPDYLNMFLYWNKLGAESCCCHQERQDRARNSKWQIFQNFTRNNKDGVQGRNKDFLSFLSHWWFLSSLNGREYAPEKNPKHFYGQRFLQFYDFWGLTLRRLGLWENKEFQRKEIGWINFLLFCEIFSV